MTVRIEFFEVSAQVLPVLFFASVLESRFRAPGEVSDRVTFHHVWRALTLMLLIFGEVVCLGTTASGHPTQLGAILVGGAYLFASCTALYPFLPAPDEDASTGLRSLWLVATIVTIVVVTGSFYWFGSQTG